jgi:cell wall-associated NlpC family hydrolase
MLDRRLNAYRPDLADVRLQNAVEAERYCVGVAARVTAPVADMRPGPMHGIGIDTQLLRGATVRLFDDNEGWAWVQADADGYVGYVPSQALSQCGHEPTHIVTAARTFVYSGPDLRLPAVAAHSMGATIAVDATTVVRGTQYAVLANGEALIAAHLAPINVSADDYVAVAERLEHTPYLWGGASGFGIDCSGLVQLSLRMAGLAVMRDTDMQEDTIGVAIDAGELRRGDLVFWKGHVAIMADHATLIHANGHTMSVSREALAAAIDRIAYLYGRPTSYRRPFPQ